MRKYIILFLFAVRPFISNAQNYSSVKVDSILFKELFGNNYREVKLFRNKIHRSAYYPFKHIIANSGIKEKSVKSIVWSKPHVSNDNEIIYFDSFGVFRLSFTDTSKAFIVYHNFLKELSDFEQKVKYINEYERLKSGFLILLVQKDIFFVIINDCGNKTFTNTLVRKLKSNGLRKNKLEVIRCGVNL